MTDHAVPASRLLERYAQRHPGEFALAIARSGSSAVYPLLASLPESVLPAVVVNLPKGMARAFLVHSSDSELVRWLSEADLDSAVRLARLLDQPLRAGLADRLPARRRKDLDRYCSFPDSSVGAYVDTDFAAVSEAQSIAEAVQALDAPESPDRIPLLVVDRKGRLAGWLDTQLALLHGPDGSVRDCLVPIRPLKANTQLYAAAVEFAALDEPWLPVIDAQSRPVGLLHRSRLPDVSASPSANAPSVLTTLAGTLFELLAELPALVATGRRAP
ncbi:MAG: hypothetical protein OXU72_15855 [Gammaproteobacteria bacterium]|nr:hypothetical protein [Gammaproteobacteria bacterium]